MQLMWDRAPKGVFGKHKCGESNKEGSSDRAELGRAVCGGILGQAGRTSGDNNTERRLWAEHGA